MDELDFAIAQTITTVAGQLLFYTSFIFLFVGLIGNLINIYIFAFVKVFRSNPSAFYLIVESILDCGVLLNIYITRILYYGYNTDLTRQYNILCKISAASLVVCISSSLTTVCFEAVDQCLATSHSFSVRQKSTLKLAQRLLLINVSFWLLHSIPFWIFYDILPTGSCDISNRGFQLYFSIVYLSLISGILPLLVSAIFSLLAYRNVRRIVRNQVPIVRRRLDRQLTAMILARVVFLILISVPYGIYLLYALNVQQNTMNVLQASILRLCSAITSCMFYFNYVGPFYLFLLASRRYRGQVRHMLLKKNWQKLLNKTRRNLQTNRNQISPESVVSIDD